MNPKIIAIIGAPRSGKSFLVKRLAEKLNYKAILEGESEDFPQFIKDDIKNNTNGLRRIIWFRNKQMNNFLEAVQVRAEGQGSILDTFWIDNQMYIDVLLTGEDKAVAIGLAETDRKGTMLPDIILYLKNNEERTREFIKLGNRDFDAGEDLFTEQILPLKSKYEEMVASLPKTLNIITIDRSSLDFTNENDLTNILEKLKK